MKYLPRNVSNELGWIGVNTVNTATRWGICKVPIQRIQSLSPRSHTCVVPHFFAKGSRGGLLPN